MKLSNPFKKIDHDNCAKILTDCDGVLLDWLGSFDQWMLEEHNKEVVNERVYCIGGRYGESPQYGKERVLEFNGSDAVDYLSPMPGAVRAVETLGAKGHTFDVITAFSDDPVRIEKRRELLEEHFGNVFGELHSHSFTTSKYPYLELYEPGHIWIEDNAANAAIGQALGHRSFLLTHPYNEDEGQELLIENKISGVSDNWHDLLQSILKELS